MKTLAGKTLFITGASRGIGRAIALRAAQDGANVVIAAKTAEAHPKLSGTIHTVADEVRKAGGKALAIQLDVRDENAIIEAVKRGAQEFGGIDILVNNAGGSRNFGKDATEEQWNEALTLNFTRHRQLAHRLLPAMAEKKWGRVINITGKMEPDNVNGAFCAKAALTAWAKGLSREVGKQGITVNCIAPGRIMSDQIRRNYTPEYRAWQSEHEIPVGRYGEPEELADLAVFLASPRGAYISGIVYFVDGGLRRYQY